MFLGSGTKYLMRVIGILSFIFAFVVFLCALYIIDENGLLYFISLEVILILQGILFNVVASLIDANISNPAEIRKRVAEENKRVNKDVKFNKIDWDD